MQPAQQWELTRKVPIGQSRGDRESDRGVAVVKYKDGEKGTLHSSNVFGCACKATGQYGSTGITCYT